MEIKIPVIKKNELPFFIVYGCYLLIALIYTSMYSKYIVLVYKYALVALIIFLLVCEIFENKYSLRSLTLTLAISMVVISVSTHVDGSIYMVCLLVFIWCARNISFEKIARFTILFSSIIILFIVLSSFLGIIENYSQFIDGRKRFYLGFRYALYLPAYMFNISSLYIYINRKNVKLIHLIIIFSLNFIVFIQTKSRLSFIMSIVLILMTALIRVFNSFFKKQKILYLLMSLSFVICFIVCVAVTVRYDSSISWMYQLNEFLVHRISLGQRGLIRYGIPFFGQTIEWVGTGMNSHCEIITEGYNYVDCLYIKMLIQYGVVFTMLYIAIHTITMFRCCRCKKYLLLIMLMFISLRVVIDDLSLLLHYNTWWFAIGLIWRDNRKNFLEVEADI